MQLITNVRKTDDKNQIFIVCLYLTTFFRARIKNNLNISIYTKKEYNSYQMEQIRIGLFNDLDVSIYAKPEYNEHQMSQIRLGLKNNLDISSICKNFDETHKSCYYDLFRMPPFNIFFK